MKLLPLAALAAALLEPLQAQAACRLVTADVPVTMEGLRPLVAAKISGKPVQLLTIRDIGGAAGLVGQNLLKTSDDEYDFKNGLLRLVRPQDCETTVLAYWVKPGETYSMIPLDGEARTNAHNVALITINGQTMRAYFDTGANLSFITAHAAAKAGVKTTDPGVTLVGMSHGLDGDTKTWVGTFSSIKIGDEEIKNGKLAIGESVANDFDVLIGADFFLAHHVYVANSQGKLYFSYSGGPVFRTSAPQKAAASGDPQPH